MVNKCMQTEASPALCVVSQNVIRKCSDESERALRVRRG